MENLDLIDNYQSNRHSALDNYINKLRTKLNRNIFEKGKLQKRAKNLNIILLLGVLVWSIFLLVTLYDFVDFSDELKVFMLSIICLIVFFIMFTRLFRDSWRVRSFGEIILKLLCFITLVTFFTIKLLFSPYVLISSYYLPELLMCLLVIDYIHTNYKLKWTIKQNTIASNAVTAYTRFKNDISGFCRTYDDMLKSHNKSYNSNEYHSLFVEIENSIVIDNSLHYSPSKLVLNELNNINQYGEWLRTGDDEKIEELFDEYKKTNYTYNQSNEHNSILEISSEISRYNTAIIDQANVLVTKYANNINNTRNDVHSIRQKKNLCIYQGLLRYSVHNVDNFTEFAYEVRRTSNDFLDDVYDRIPNEFFKNVFNNPDNVIDSLDDAFSMIIISFTNWEIANKSENDFKEYLENISPEEKQLILLRIEQRQTKLKYEQEIEDLQNELEYSNSTYQTQLRKQSAKFNSNMQKVNQNLRNVEKRAANAERQAQWAASDF